MALPIVYTDPAAIGDSLIAVVIRLSDGTIWNKTTQSFDSIGVARTSDHEVDLAELVPPAVPAPGYPGMFVEDDEADIDGIDEDEEVLIRIEESGDPSNVPIGVLNNAPSGGGGGGGDCITLDTEIPETDIGSGLLTVGDALRILLGVAIGRVRISRTLRWIRFYFLDNTPIRTLNLVQNAAESERNPPGEGGPDPDE